MGEIRDLLHAHLFDQAPIAIAVLDQDFRFVEANARFRRVFGDWEERHCFELLKRRTETCEGCMAQKTFVDGKVRVHDESLTSEGGKSAHFVVRVAPLAWAAPNLTHNLTWMASDVNEATSLQLENELLFERAPCYICVLDPEMRIIRSNRRMRETFGGGRGKRCYEVYKRRDRVCRDCPALETFEDGKDHTSTQVGLTVSGEEVHYVVTASAFSWEEGDPDSRVKYVIEMATDVTQLKVLEREKLDAERLAAVGQTVAGLAHGIKNMLMGLQGGAYVVESGLRQGQMAKAQRGVQMLTRNLEKISSLVKDLLSFSKGRIPQVALTDPNAVARDIHELFGPLARKVGIEITTDLQSGLASAPLDAGAIHSCLANLISNAIDACQVSEKSSCTVVLRTFENEGVLGFDVLDNGCGMDYDIKKRLFTTFFTTKGEGGTGLGLLMTRKIVQEHGGKILFDSQPGQGTKFTILLPRERLPQRTPTLPEGGAPDAGQGVSSHAAADGRG
jgi:signal transduction histidine kinase